MEYEITITKRELNPDYKPDRYIGAGCPSQYLEKNVLQTVLTEKEFKQIRDAIMTQF